MAFWMSPEISPLFFFLTFSYLIPFRVFPIWAQYLSMHSDFGTFHRNSLSPLPSGSTCHSHCFTSQFIYSKQHRLCRTAGDLPGAQQHIHSPPQSTTWLRIVGNSAAAVSTARNHFCKKKKQKKQKNDFGAGSLAAGSLAAGLALLHFHWLLEAMVLSLYWQSVLSVWPWVQMPGLLVIPFPTFSQQMLYPGHSPSFKNIHHCSTRRLFLGNPSKVKRSSSAPCLGAPL